jgi:hypothetical protein
MKNIHILPTDKPSRLRYFDSKLEIMSLIPKKSDIVFQNIYITNNEEIKEGNWHLNIVTNKISKYNIGLLNPNRSNYKKIILTTDQSLNGIQSIDDKFLEWFVKNPSCENVEIEIKPMFPMYSTFIESIDNPPFYGNLKRKIIIPQEELKQETIEEAADIEKIAMDKLKNKWGHLYTFGYPKRPFPTNYENDLNNIKIGLYEGAKYQAEKMYSEEDMIEILHSRMKYTLGEDYKEMTTIEWFEQFKKK